MRAPTSTSHHARWLIACMVLAGACTKPPPDESSEHEPVPVESPPNGLGTPASAEGIGAPVIVRVSGPPDARAGSELEIEVTVQRRRPSSTPIDLSVDVPPGAELLEGRATETITDAVSTQIRRAFVLRLARIPNADLRASVDVRGSSHGAHATGSYRFGRPEPKLPQPPRSSKQTLIGGRSFGRPIPLSQPADSIRHP